MGIEDLPIGTVRRGRFIGKPGYSSLRFRLVACPECGLRRWLALKGGPRDTQDPSQVPCAGCKPILYAKERGR